MASPKPIKMVELKWISRADKKKVSPKKYNLRSRKKQPPNDQKKIHSYFSVSPQRKIHNNRNEKTPVKKQTETTSSNDDLYLSPSVKYDSLVPKVEDILRARKNDEEFKKIHAIIQESSKRFLEGLANRKNEQVDTKTKETPVKFNNCKHLTNTQLTKRFKKDLKYIDDLFYGRVPNERYELFQKDTPLNNGTKNDLRVNDSNFAFTQDQLIHIVSLFRERYDQGNMYKYSDFYFKVLLPEYCLKIFADVYKMTPADALDYLKSIPVQDVYF